MLKKGSIFSTLVLVFIIVFLAAPLLKAGVENPEVFEDLLCDNVKSLACYDLFENNTLADSILYEFQNNGTCPKEVVSYLSRHEKSPPIVAA